MTELTLALIASYLVGSIPSALIAGRILGGIDIREHGSGNVGATNVYRVFGMKPYIATLLADMFKGFAAVVFIAPTGSGLISEQRTALLCGVFAVVGHIWTIFAQFKGGKGVATAGGMLLGLDPVVTLAAVAVYLLVTLTTKYVALGSISAGITVPILLSVKKLALGYQTPVELIFITLALSILIVFTHRGNIARLLRGEEDKTEFLGKSGQR